MFELSCDPGGQSAQAADEFDQSCFGSEVSQQSVLKTLRQADRTIVSVFPTCEHVLSCGIVKASPVPQNLSCRAVGWDTPEGTLCPILADSTLK